jgi:paraquat-inducible protein A
MNFLYFGQTVLNLEVVMQIQCPICFQINIVPDMDKGQTAYCCKCDSPVLKHKTGVILKTLVFTISASVLYVPANMLPILSMEKFGMYSENTILSGCAELLKNGFWGIAIIWSD